MTSNNDPVTNNSLGDTSGSDDTLTSLVGEGKKFRSVEDLARGKVESDSFIEKLKEENNALRALIRNSDDTKAGADAMRDLLARVSQSTLGRNTQGDGNPNTPKDQGNQPPVLTSRDVENVYKLMRQKEREDANEAAALQKVREIAGDQTDAFLSKKASEVALDVNTLKAMARQSPTAFLNLVGVNGKNNQATTNAAPRSSVNSAAIVDIAGDSAARDKRYYDKLKKEMGTKPFIMDRSLQIQMHKDMQALGDRWDAA